jgi:hypothetical protein
LIQWRWVFLFLIISAGWLSISSNAAGEDFTFEIMGGDAYNFPIPLTVHQNGYPDINLTAQYDTKPYSAYAPYYAWQMTFWDKDEGWEFGQVHHKMFLTDPPPEIQNFAIHYGYNYFLFGHAWKRSGLIFHLDTGPIITNPSNTVRGQVLETAGTGWFDQGYDFSGWGVQIAVSKNFYLNANGFVIAEVGLMGGWAWTVPVSNGSANVPNLSLHGRLGLGLSL